MIYKICKECEKENNKNRWCKECNTKHFQQNFKNWTSGNNDIDKFIQDTQLSATNYEKVLEWIPYNKLYDIEYIAKGGFGKVYKAKWIDGYIRSWDINENWKRDCSNWLVALKSLNNSENVTSEFINEIKMHCMAREYQTVSVIRVYGITQDPETKNYMMVLPYAEDGSLRAYLDKNYHELSWETKIGYLHHITSGLKSIHNNGLTHRDLHIGNILSFGFVSQVMITDMGLCKPADYNASENPKN
ncbi:kinase-like domain-containing protein, partial [Rhizophagus irregularis DAOM 181602=DAOM 197198]